MASFGYRFKQFVKRHEHWFTFAGAFIVVMTFIVKEGLGDHWREIAGQVDRAQSAYATETARNLEIAQHKQILDVVKKAGTTDSDFRTLDFASWAEINHVKLSNIETILVTIIPLIEKLPSESKTKGNQLFVFAENFRKATDEQIATDASQTAIAYQYRSKGVRPVLMFDTSKPGWEYSSPNADKIKQDFYNIRIDGSVGRSTQLAASLSAFQSDLDGFVKNVLKDAEQIRSDNEVLSRLAWWITVVLFALGWGLGLIGKIYGAHADGGE